MPSWATITELNDGEYPTYPGNFQTPFWHEHKLDAQYWMVSPFPPEATYLKSELFRQAASGLLNGLFKITFKYADDLPPHDHVSISLGGEYAALAKYVYELKSLTSVVLRGVMAGLSRGWAVITAERTNDSRPRVLIIAAPSVGI